MVKNNTKNQRRWETFNFIIDTPSPNLGNNNVKITHTDKLVWLVLFRESRLDKKTEKYLPEISIRRISDKSEATAKKVMESVKKLIKIRMVRIVKKGDRNGSATIYEVRHLR